MRKEYSGRGWNPLPIWEGATAFILGGGPSLSNIDLNRLHNKHVIGCNNAYGDPVKNEKGETIEYIPRDWVDICWFGDSNWFSFHLPYLKLFRGILATSKFQIVEKHKHLGIKGFLRGRPFGISTESGYICWNKSTGASAINLATKLGAKRIVLLGFDMRIVDGKKNYHKDHILMGKIQGRFNRKYEEKKDDPFEHFLKAFPHIARDAEKLGIEIINATPGSAITQFPIVEPDEVL